MTHSLRIPKTASKMSVRNLTISPGSTPYVSPLKADFYKDADEEHEDCWEEGGGRCLNLEQKRERRRTRVVGFAVFHFNKESKEWF